MSFQDHVKAVATVPVEFTHLRAAMLAQSIMESGREDTELSKQHNNSWGMKWRPEMQGYATSVYYKTDSEPTGGADFCKFESKEAGVKGYWQFLTRSPYVGWRNHVKDAADFLGFICPIWCPAGYTDSWKAKHGWLSYHEYVLKNLLPEAEKLLSEIPVSDAETIVKIEFNRKDDGTPVAIAFNKTDAKFVHVVKDWADLIAWSKNFPNLSLVAVQDTSLNIPKLPDVGEVAKPVEPKPTDGKLPLWASFAKRYDNGMKVKGPYPEKFPRGMIVHFSAGRGSGEGMLDYCVEQGYTVHFAIDKKGNIIQSAPLDSWGNHCGTSHQETHVGVEIINAGRLTKKTDGTFWSWFGTEIPKDNVRWVDYPESAEQIDGYYEKYTPEQEAALVKLILWLRDNGKGIFKLDNVIGHDEACCRSPRGKGAKNDPSGALSMSMPEFRAFLKSK